VLLLLSQKAHKKKLKENSDSIISLVFRLELGNDFDFIISQKELLLLSNFNRGIWGRRNW